MYNHHLTREEEIQSLAEADYYEQLQRERNQAAASDRAHQRLVPEKQTMTEAEALSLAAHALREYCHHLNWADDQVGGNVSDEHIARVNQAYEAHHIIKDMYYARIRQETTPDEDIPF